VLIANKAATLQELRTVYSLEDAYYIHESIMVPKENEARCYEAARRKHNLPSS